MTVRDRFILFLKKENIQQKTLADKIGYRPQTLSRFIKGHTDSPKIDLIVGLAQHYPELNLRWLLLGEGEMMSASSFIIPVNEKQNVETLLIENSQLKDRIIELLEGVV